MPKPTKGVLREAMSSGATAVDGKPGRFLIQLISPGWGSSGYYSPAVVEAAAGPDVWPAGTHMYIDHPTRSEEYDRPERTIRDLAAVLTENARWDKSLGALVAEAQVFPMWRDALAEMRDAIGVSIRAYAESEPGEADGRKGQIVTDLVEGVSVDFVTHAGRDGKILEVIESASRRSEIASLTLAESSGLSETTANDTRDLLDTAITDAYGGDQVWVYVIDFDASTVWFCQSEPDSRVTYAQSYTMSGSTVTLDGSPTEVRAVTTFVPVDPAGQSAENKSEEDNMPQIEESRLRQLEEDARRVSEAESKLASAEERATAAETRATAAESQVAATERGRTVARIMREALDADSHKGIDLNDFERRGILADAVVNDGTVDESATRAAFDKALDKLIESGKGDARVRNLGGGSQVDESTQDEDPLATIDAMMAESFSDFGDVDVMQEA